MANALKQFFFLAGPKHLANTLQKVMKCNHGINEPMQLSITRLTPCLIEIWHCCFETSPNIAVALILLLRPCALACTLRWKLSSVLMARTKTFQCVFFKITISPPVHPPQCEHNGMWYVLEELAVISALLTKESSRGA